MGLGLTFCVSFCGHRGGKRPDLQSTLLGVFSINPCVFFWCDWRQKIRNLLRFQKKKNGPMLLKCSWVKVSLSAENVQGRPSQPFEQ